MKYQQAKALAWARTHAGMEPTTIARLAGARYNTRGVYSAALAQVCAEHGVERAAVQPSGDRTDYIRRPLCWIFEDRAVPCSLSTDALVMPPEA